MYDVVIAGGSVSGLLCAREISAKGFAVLVIEEDYEIGTPEHCGGLVSSAGLEQLGIIPHAKTLTHLVESATVISPSGKKFTINSKKQKVIEINRRELDKQIAQQAQKNGTEIRVKTSFQNFSDGIVKTSEQQIPCKIFVDARGVSSLIHKDRKGILSSAQFEVLANWIKKGKVEVYLDQKKYPGFFAWVIPSSDGKGKVGVAGRGINVADALERFLTAKGNFSIIRKIFAPIWVKGPIPNFVENNFVIIGDAAGQSKPTTAGGIYSCGIGGILAGRAIAKFLQTKNQSDLENYQKEWNEKFGKEFDKQKLARNFLERLDNDSIDQLFDLISPKIISDIENQDDFDFHTSSIIKLVGVKGSMKVAKAFLSGELKNLLPP